MKGLQVQWSVRNSRNPVSLHSLYLSRIACLDHPRDMYSNLVNSGLSNLKGVGTRMIVYIYRAINGYRRMVSTQSLSKGLALLAWLKIISHFLVIIAS